MTTEAPPSTCYCGDDDQLQLLRDLIKRGVNQWDASLIAFGEPPRISAGPEVHRIWVRIHVRRLTNRHRAELGMPLLSERLAAVYPPPLEVVITAIDRVSDSLLRLGNASRRAADRLRTVAEA